MPRNNIDLDDFQLYACAGATNYATQAVIRLLDILHRYSTLGRFHCRLFNLAGETE